MFHNLGVQWAGSLLGFLAIAFWPIPILFYVYGERLRGMSRYAPNLKKPSSAPRPGSADDDVESQKSE